MDFQVDPQLVINDLLEQVKQLTLQNAMLRALVKKHTDQNEETPVD